MPGNVRELEHVVEKTLILTEKDRIDLEALGEISGSGAGGGAATLATMDEGVVTPFDFAELTLEDFDQRWLETESAYLRYLVQKAQGNVSQAARLAGVRHRNTLVARLKRHGIGR